MKTSQLNHAQVAARAYQIHLANGCQPGHALDDWLQAQYELLERPVRTLTRIKPSPASPVRLLIGVVHGALLLSLS